MQIYFHELTNEEFDKIRTLTWGEAAQRFKQPDWCDYPNALMGAVGCWSLTSRRIRGEGDCIGCECHKGGLR